MAELLNRIAFDEDKNIVFVENAVKGKNYFCPECNGRFVYKNSGKTGPGTKRPHFAHVGDSHNCTPESILHAAFKTKAAEILKKRIEKGEKYPIEWLCSQCKEKYPYDILFMAKSVEVEHDLKQCRPDIALLDGEGNVVVVIEVVVSHAPEENTLKFYHDNGIVLLRYNVKEEDLLDIEEKLKHPDDVSQCLNSKCSCYNTKAIKREVDAPYSTKCNRCQQDIVFYYRAILYSPIGGIYDYNLTQHDLVGFEIFPNLVPGRLNNINVWVSRCRCLQINQLVYRPMVMRTHRNRVDIDRMLDGGGHYYNNRASTYSKRNSNRTSSYKRRRK